MFSQIKSVRIFAIIGLMVVASSFMQKDIAPMRTALPTVGKAKSMNVERQSECVLGTTRGKATFLVRIGETFRITVACVVNSDDDRSFDSHPITYIHISHPDFKSEKVYLKSGDGKCLPGYGGTYTANASEVTITVGSDPDPKDSTKCLYYDSIVTIEIDRDDRDTRR